MPRRFRYSSVNMFFMCTNTDVKYDVLRERMLAQAVRVYYRLERTVGCSGDSSREIARS